MNSIVILDANTANKVAAGEVVERPSSAVKELVENAIDAGAGRVEIECGEGGTVLIRVSDNGSGMTAGDAEKSVLRHATSKIRNIEDLTRISSMGFRGEALPSIAAVSKFTLETKDRSSTLATKVSVTGGSPAELASCGREQGTTVTVRELFYNVPARKKFLKSSASENTHIVNMLSKIAMSNCNVAIKYIHNGKLLLNTPGNGKLIDSIVALYGKNTAAELLEIDFASGSIHVYGYVAKPSQIRSNRSWQTFCVNRRIISSKILYRALDNAYHSLLPRHGYVFAALNIDMPTDLTDINVHPQKQEIKFANEQEIYTTVYKAVSVALSGADARNATDNASPTGVAAPARYFSPAAKKPGNVQHEQPRLVNIEEIREAVKRHDSSDRLNYHNEPAYEYDDSVAKDISSIAEHADISAPAILGVYDNTYIVAEINGELLIIDQHAAHERILYDRLYTDAARLPSQKLLIDEFVDLSAQECQLALDHALDFYELGYVVEAATPTTLRISEIPADLPGSPAVEVFISTLRYFAGHHKADAGEIRREFLQTAACKAACKAGDPLTYESVARLIKELLNTKLPYTCPHGRPTAIKYSRADLDKAFRRS